MYILEDKSKHNKIFYNLFLAILFFNNKKNLTIYNLLNPTQQKPTIQKL